MSLEWVFQIHIVLTVRKLTVHLSVLELPLVRDVNSHFIFGGSVNSLFSQKTQDSLSTQVYTIH